jgi:hypothetical protein
LHHYGEGYGLYFATQADGGHIHHSPSILKDALLAVHLQIGLSPRVWVAEPQNPNRAVDPHVLDGDNFSFLLVSALKSASQYLSLVLNDDRRAKQVHLVYPDVKPLDWSQGEGQLSVMVSTQPEQEVSIIKIDWM